MLSSGQAGPKRYAEWDTLLETKLKENYEGDSKIRDWDTWFKSHWRISPELGFQISPTEC